MGKCILSPSSGARPRPVLIKLATTWDRKVVLLHKRNLQDFRLKHLFLRADVLPEHRLRQSSSIVRAKPPADDLQLPVNSAAASAVLTSPGQSQPSVSTPAPKLSSTVQSSTVPHPHIATSSSVPLHSLSSSCDRLWRSSSVDSASSSSSTSTIVEGLDSQ